MTQTLDNTQTGHRFPTDAAITVAGLSRVYGSGKKAYTAVEKPTFHVNRGEVFGLLGTNGAGKTSILEILEGLAEPTSGQVRILGLDPVADRQQLRPDVALTHGRDVRLGAQNRFEAYTRAREHGWI